MNRTIYLFLSGILIGTCMILPGVSGSVIAIMLGIYEDVIILLNDDSKCIIKIKKLFSLCLGMIIGIFIFGKVLLVVYNNYSFYMMYVFIGLILGGVPLLIEELKQKNNKINYGYLIVSLMASLILFLGPKILNIKPNGNSTPLKMLFGGFLYISGKIIPGISSSFFLMSLGIYEYILGILVNPFSITVSDIINILPFITGVIIGFFVLIKLINFLIKKYFCETYSSIIGFIIGSIISIFPGFELSIKCLISLIYMIISFIIVKKLSKK